MKYSKRKSVSLMVTVVILCLIFIMPTVAASVGDSVPTFDEDDFDDCSFGAGLKLYSVSPRQEEGKSSIMCTFNDDPSPVENNITLYIGYSRNADHSNDDFQSCVEYAKMYAENPSYGEVIFEEEKVNEYGNMRYMGIVDSVYAGNYCLLSGENWHASFNFQLVFEEENESESRNVYNNAKNCIMGIISGKGLVDAEPDLELTYPVGQSPKVFTKGWVFGAHCTYTDDDGKEIDISDEVSWGGTGNFKPDKGSRSYPTFTSAGQNTIELSVQIGNENYTKEFQVDAVNTSEYARLTDLAKCPIDAHGCPACPHSTVGPIIFGSSNVSIDGLPAARVGDHGIHAACCGPNMYTIVSGDKNVLIDGMPAARKGDQTRHCGGMGRLVSGSSGVESKIIQSEHHTCKIPTEVDLNADEGGTISGKVTDSLETGIVGVGVTAYGETNIDVWGAITDENGEYQITGLPDDNFNIHFWGSNWDYNDGYLSLWYNGKSNMDTADTVTITAAASVTGIDVTLDAGGSISGTVKDASGGGIEKAIVEAYGKFGRASFGYTDENGEYTISGLENNSYQVSCNAGLQGYIGEWYNDKSSQNSGNPVTVTVPSQVSGIDFSLAGAGGISGTVKDTSGSGIEGVYVKAFGESTRVTCMAVTDESGAYEILGIRDDSYRVQFQGEAQGYGDQWYNNISSWDLAEFVTVTAPNKTTGINAELPLESELTTTTTTDGGVCPSEKIYGEYSKETELLRYVRDNILNKTPEGQELIKLYYAWSPAIVQVMEEDKAFNEEVRETMDGILGLIGKAE